MADQQSFTISRNDMRKILVGLGMTEKTILALFGVLDKAHRHINAIALVTTVERMGLDREMSIRLLRRLGMDDITINNIFRMVDESKINAEIGRVYDAKIVFD